MTNLPTVQPAPTWQVHALNLGSIALAVVAIATLLVTLSMREDRAHIGPTHERLADLVVPPDEVLDVAADRNDPRVLADVTWAPDGLRASRAVFCVETSISADALTDALGEFDIVWVVAGQEQARVSLDDSVRAPRYGLDRRCMELDAVTLDLDTDAAEPDPTASVGEVADYRLVLTGDLDVIAAGEHGDAAVVTMVVDSRAMAWYERGAVIALMLAMLMRLLLWQARAAARLTQRVWRPFDPLLAVAGAFVLSAVAASALGGGYDAALMSFSSAESIEGITRGSHALGSSDVDTFLALLFANAAVFAGVAWGLARMRTPHTATALRTVHTPRFGLLYPLLGGVALAVLASLLLVNFQPDQTSHMQWMTSMPGTLLATAAFACLSPWFEELFFRGLVFSSVEGVAGRNWAAAISGALFLLAHVPQHVGFLLPLVPILIVAGVCTWLRYASGSTTPAFALHLGYNALLVLPALFV